MFYYSLLLIFLHNFIVRHVQQVLVKESMVLESCVVLERVHNTIKWIERNYSRC